MCTENTLPLKQWVAAIALLKLKTKIFKNNISWENWLAANVSVRKIFRTLQRMDGYKCLLESNLHKTKFLDKIFGSNMWKKVDKSSKIGQERKGLKTFACF